VDGTVTLVEVVPLDAAGSRTDARVKENAVTAGWRHHRFDGRALDWAVPS
jgi:hypothetical protein